MGYDPKHRKKKKVNRGQRDRTVDRVPALYAASPGSIHNTLYDSLTREILKLFKLGARSLSLRLWED